MVYFTATIAGRGIFVGLFVVQEKQRVFFIAYLFPFLFLFGNLGVTGCGWRYRMELRDRYAIVSYGRVPSYSAININVMPPNVRSEYAKHDYHPRFRYLKALIIGILFLTPIILLSGVIFWRLFFYRRNMKE